MPKRETLSKRDAYICYRVLCRIEAIADRSMILGDETQAVTLWKLLGRLQYNIYGSASIGELGS